ncbi:MAG: chemotaxis protein CheW [Halobacteriales archaeon]
MASASDAAEVRQADGKVLQFRLGGSDYCVDIADVDEIVEADDELTEVPNTPPHVAGVMDLRGRTTTIVDPRIALDLDTAVEPTSVVVFDSDDAATGWLVEDVERVRSVADVPENRAHADGAVGGVYEFDDGYVIRVVPDELG